MLVLYQKHLFLLKIRAKPLENISPKSRKVIYANLDKIDHLTGWAFGYNTNWLEINFDGEINQYSENSSTSFEQYDTFGNVLINELNNNILYE